jgi:hypothetical protein
LRRLARDVQWLRGRGLWSRDLYQRALSRAADYGATLDELSVFMVEYAEADWREPESETSVH